ncbi:hypothetical protein Syun_031344 [Stephania yunnanensis]|uniref:Uncharacterized protein n=1 Tax=Stephania yunnanensis TaxID=152371 RepID=A0AAP0DXG5_9MAGN
MASCQGCQPKKEPVKAPTPTHLPKKTEVKPQEPKKSLSSMKKNKSCRNPLKWIKRKLCHVPANNIIEDTKAEPRVAVVASSVLSPPSDGHDGEKKHDVDNVKRIRSEAK